MGFGSPVQQSVHRVDHEITEYCGTVKRDGYAVRITLEKDRKWMRVGCTRISVDALKALYAYAQEHCPADEIVLQQGA